MNIDLLLDRFFTYSLYLGVPPLLIGLWYWKRLSRSLRIFWLALLAYFIITLISEWLVDQRINNEFMAPIGTAIDGLLMALFFGILPSFRAIRSFVWLACGGLLLFIGFSVWYWGITFQTSRLLSTVESVPVVAACLWVLRSQFQQSIHRSLRREPLVWIVMGVLAANAVTVVLNSFGTILYTYSGPLFSRFWDVLVPLCLLIYYGFACVGFWHTRSQLIRSF